MAYNTNEDYPTILYGLNFFTIIIFAPLWVPFWLLGIVAKKLGIKP